MSGAGASGVRLFGHVLLLGSDGQHLGRRVCRLVGRGHAAQVGADVAVMAAAAAALGDGPAVHAHELDRRAGHDPVARKFELVVAGLRLAHPEGHVRAVVAVLVADALARRHAGQLGLAVVADADLGRVLEAHELDPRRVRAVERTAHELLGAVGRLDDLAPRQEADVQFALGLVADVDGAVGQRYLDGQDVGQFVGHE